MKLVLGARVAGLLQLMRPHEWIKNLFVFAPVVFSGYLTAPAAFWRSCVVFGVFCAASSFGYVLNDLLDREHDRHHPAKQHRPLPSGAVRVSEAALLAAILLLVTQVASAVQSMGLWLLANAYLATSVLYSVYLKRKVIVDVLTIATGFVLRVLGGAVAVAVTPSRWLILCTFLLATFLGFSKRRHELVRLGGAAQTHRWVLTLYSEEFLDQMNLVTITLTLTCYIFYTIAPETIERFGTPHLLYSVLLVMLGLFRYLFLVHKKQQGSPVEVLYSDRQVVLIVLLWLVYMVWCIYTWPALRPWIAGDRFL